MKLSNQQLEALVSKVYNEEQKINDKIYLDAKKKVQSDKKHLAVAKKYAAALNSIPQSLRKRMYIDKGDEKEFLAYITRPLIPELKHVEKQPIRDKILIASIESDTLIQLQDKLKIKL